MLFTIQTSSENIAPGNYQATFNSMEPLETKNGKAYRWAFKTDDGRTISGLSDAEKPPTTKNKTGRWLCALANEPVQAGVSIDPAKFVGRKYFLIVIGSENGSKLETFSLMA